MPALVAAAGLSAGAVSTASAASVAKGPMRGWTPARYVEDMVVGWNLGNTLDAVPNETSWGNPTTTQAMIDAVHDMGFKFLRLPVTWKDHMGGAPDFLIDPAWMAKAVAIANYALNDSMYVMINIHHDGTDGGWFPLNATGTQVDANKSRVAAVWKQIAETFKDYGDYVLFEVFNEPQNGAPNMYGGGDAASRSTLAEYQKAAVAAIRATGGNNATRMIVLQGISASPIAVSVGTIPMVDENTIVSIHTYDPVQYSMECTPNTWGSASDSAAILANLRSIRNMVADKHGTAIIGEWATKSCDDRASRVKHAYFYSRQCRLHGMLPVWWDDGGDFHLLNRKTNPPSWDFEDIAQAVVDGSESAEFPIAIRPAVRRTGAQPGLLARGSLIRYSLPEPAEVFLRLMKIDGTPAADLLHGRREAGSHEASAPSALPRGHYILELKAGAEVVRRSLALF